MMAMCGKKCEIWSRPCGYYRPVSEWNRGKKNEFKDRKTFEFPQSTKSQSDCKTRFAGHGVAYKTRFAGEEK
jgi:hypothetical protein